ncbi:MAG: PIN domain-containing protein [Acidobacteriia bacterium]|nr:PIN domain-containing protein [Terriglobia bacterium]
MKKVSSKLLLLDVNVLLALAWPNHQFHASARKRLEGSRDRWATCALTQLGFIRISSNPAAVGTAKSPAEAARLLAEMVSDRLHVYLDALPPPVSSSFIGSFQAILGSQQVTDAYLLSLARTRKATLVTFDARLAALGESGAEVEILSSRDSA